MSDFLYLQLAKRGRGDDDSSRKMPARIIQSHCHFRGKINRIDCHYQGGKDAISRCGKQGGHAGTGQCNQQREA